MDKDQSSVVGRSSGTGPLSHPKRRRMLVRMLVVFFVLAPYSILVIALLAVEDPNLLHRYLGIGKDLSSTARFLLMGVLVGGAWVVFGITGWVANAKERREKRRILTTGTKAAAVVQGVEDLRVSYSYGEHIQSSLLRVHVQVMPEGESPFTASFDEVFSFISLPRRGDTLWVFYDPADRSKVAVSQS